MSVAANRYAKALIDVLYPDKAEAGFDQLQALSRLLHEQPEGLSVLANPTISVDRRKALLKEIGDALAFNKPIRNFVGLLVERNRFDLLEDILPAYQKLMDERLGVVQAHVTVARPLDALEQQELAGKLQTLTGKKVRMEVAVDQSLIGGAIAQVGSTIYDGSLSNQLKAFKKRLTET